MALAPATHVAGRINAAMRRRTIAMRVPRYRTIRAVGIVGVAHVAAVN